MIRGALNRETRGLLAYREKEAKLCFECKLPDCVGQTNKRCLIKQYRKAQGLTDKT